MNNRKMLLALCALAVPAAAAGDFYAGVGGGVYRVDSGEFDDTSPTTELFGGFQLNRNVAFEATYLRMFEAEDVIGGNRTELDGNVWEVSTKLSYPLAQRFQAFGRLGWSYYVTTLESEGINGRFRERDYGDDFSWGVGASYDITQRLGLRGEYGEILVDDGDAEFFSLGLSYGFGQK